MKNYVMICVLIGVMSSALVADSLSLKSYLLSGPCPDNFTGMVPHPTDCHSFYICDAGLPGLIPCPAGLCFNSQSEACDHCELVPGCDSATGTPPTSSPSSSTEQSSTTTEQPPSSSSSPPDTPTTQPPNSSSPPPDTTTTQRTTTPSGEELSCPTDVPYIYMPYPGDCNRFYYCQEGVNTGVYNCGEGLWFHFRQQVCSLPWSSTCEARK